MQTLEGNNNSSWFSKWLPTRGNVIFTLLIISTLVWAQSAGAFPAPAPETETAATSTGTIAYQGRLADADGNPLTDMYPMVFRLYNAPSASAYPLWEENWTGANSVQVSDGLFNVMLGTLTSIPQNIVTENSTLWLGISVDNDDEMIPRVQLGSVPFAVQANTVLNGSITTEKIVDGAVTSGKIANGGVATADLADNVVTAAKIADNAVGSSEIAANAVGSSEIAANAVGSSEIADGSVTYADLASSAASKITIFSEPVKVIDGSSNGHSYSNVDLSSVIPASATSVLVEIACNKGTDNNSPGMVYVRKPGSTERSLTAHGEGGWGFNQGWVGTSGQSIQYELVGTSVWHYIWVIGYLE